MTSVQCQILRVNTPGTYKEDLYLIFNLEHANYIRERRIHGRFVGSALSLQTATSTNRKTNNHLPFKLTESEVGLIVEYLINNNEESVEIVTQNQVAPNNLDVFKEKFQNYKNELIEVKNTDYINLRKAQLNQMRDKIVSAKRKKLSEQLDKLVGNEEARSKVCIYF